MFLPVILLLPPVSLVLTPRIFYYGLKTEELTACEPTTTLTGITLDEGCGGRRRCIVNKVTLNLPLGQSHVCSCSVQ